jgi:hypothetical protein
MAALVTNRSTMRKGFEALVPTLNYGIAAATKLYQGGMVALTAAGFLTPVTAATGLNVVGVVGDPGPQGLDNTGGAGGAISTEVRRGIFKFNPGTAGDAVTQASIGLPAYAMDDNTVSPVATGRTKVGVFTEIDPDGQVWVQIIGPI